MNYYVSVITIVRYVMILHRLFVGVKYSYIVYISAYL
jgi:hypothetical protein